MAEMSSSPAVEWAAKDTVQSIGSNAFSNCTALANIELPNSLGKIDNSAFNRTTTVFTVDCGTYACKWAGDNKKARDVRNLWVKESLLLQHHIGQ